MHLDAALSGTCQEVADSIGTQLPTRRRVAVHLARPEVKA